MTRGWWFAARPRVLAALLAIAVSAACNSSPAAPTTTTTTLFFSTETFVGSLAASGTAAQTFTVTQTGPVSVTLASLLVNGSPVTSSVGLGVGTPNGTDCTLDSQFTTPSQFTAAPALTAQITGSSQASGTRCVGLVDVNNVGPVNYAIRVVHP